MKNNVDILKSDGQGRTPVHYAALYGSIDCLKIFKEYHVDLKITDHNGANACHHATSGGHVNCLKYLTKVGLPFEAKDKSAKTSAHYVRCRHLIWLITGMVNMPMKAHLHDCFFTTLGCSKGFYRMSTLVVGTRR